MSLVSEDLFIQIIGCPRSGTYLLATLLEQSLGVGIPIETQIAEAFSKLNLLKKSRITTIEKYALFFSLKKYWQILYKKGLRHRENNISNASLLSVIDKIEIENIDSPENLVSELYRKYAYEKGFKYYGDKTAPYEPIDINKYISLLPKKVKIIHIIRDPRDVCLSWCKEWFGPLTIAESAILWKKHLGIYQKWGKKHPSLYLEVRYENLLIETDKILDKIKYFLNIPSLNLLNNKIELSVLSQAIGSETTHMKLTNEIDKNNYDKWRNNMSRSDRILIESIAGNKMNELNYEISVNNPTILENILVSLRICYAYILRYISINYWKRRLRDWVLLILYLVYFMKFYFIKIN